MQELRKAAGAGSGQKAEDFLLHILPQCMVEQNPQPEALPPDLLLLWQGVHQFREQEKEILQPGVPPDQPLWRRSPLTSIVRASGTVKRRGKA